MKYLTFAVAVTLSMWCGNVWAERRVQDHIAGERLDPRIGRADPARYESIRDAADWKNPYLHPHAGGVWLTARRWKSEPQNVRIADLRKIMIQLPVAAWPYGAVVVLDSGGGPQGIGDAPAIAANRKAIRAVLESLKIRVEDWP